MGPAATSPVDDRAAATSRTAALHAEHGAALLRYCRSRLPSQEDAEDATQIVFMNAYRHLASGTEPLSDAAWLFTIADRVVLTRRRSLARRARVEFPADMEDLGRSVQQHAEPRSDLLGLTDLLARIPEDQRQAILLREWRGLPHRSIAAELGVSVGTVDTLIVRARRALWEELRVGARRRIPYLVSLVAWLRRCAPAGDAAQTVAGAAAVVVAVVGTAHVSPTGIASAGTHAQAAQQARSTMRFSQAQPARNARPVRFRARQAAIAGAQPAAARQPGLTEQPMPAAETVPDWDSNADAAPAPPASPDVALPAAASPSAPAATDVAQVPAGGDEPPAQPEDTAGRRSLQGQADNPHRANASFKAGAPAGLEPEAPTHDAAREHGGGPPVAPLDPPGLSPDQVPPTPSGTPAAAAAGGQSTAADHRADDRRRS